MMPLDDSGFESNLMAYNSSDGGAGDYYPVGGGGESYHEQQQQQQQQQQLPQQQSHQQQLQQQQQQQQQQAQLQQQQQQQQLLVQQQQQLLVQQQHRQQQQQAAFMAPATQRGQMMIAPYAHAQQARQALVPVGAPLVPAEPGYLEMLWDRRRAVLKLCILSLVVLLAISGHATIWHYLQDYIEGTDLTNAQEVALRLAYPAAVLIVLWHIKTFLLD